MNKAEGTTKKGMALEALMCSAIRAFRRKSPRGAEIRNVAVTEGTGSVETGWKDATFKIDYVERGEYHVCYISVTQSVPDGYVYEEGEQTNNSEE